LKLKQHHEDVQFLKKLSENRLSLRPIAERYERLIFGFEYLDDLYFLSDFEGRALKRVRKDAGVK